MENRREVGIVERDKKKAADDEWKLWGVSQDNQNERGDGRGKKWNFWDWIRGDSKNGESSIKI